MSIFKKKLVETLGFRRNFYKEFIGKIKNKKLNYPNSRSGTRNEFCDYLSSSNYFKNNLNEFLFIYGEYNSLVEQTVNLCKGLVPLDQFKSHVELLDEEVSSLLIDKSKPPINFQCVTKPISESFKVKVKDSCTNLFLKNNVLISIIPKEHITVAESYLFDKGDEFRLITQLQSVFEKYEKLIKDYCILLYK